MERLDGYFGYTVRQEYVNHNLANNVMCKSTCSSSYGWILGLSKFLCKLPRLRSTWLGMQQLLNLSSGKRVHLTLIVIVWTR